MVAGSVVRGVTILSKDVYASLLWNTYFLSVSNEFVISTEGVAEAERPACESGFACRSQSKSR